MEKQNLASNSSKSIILALRLTVILPPPPDSHSNLRDQIFRNLEKVESGEENLTADKRVTLNTCTQPAATRRLIVIALPATRVTQ